MTLACPDCGNDLEIDGLTSGTFVCTCLHECCRADFIEHGKTRDEAADKFVQKCERYGYLTALESKLQSLVGEVVPTVHTC